MSKAFLSRWFSQTREITRDRARQWARITGIDAEVFVMPERAA